MKCRRDYYHIFSVRAAVV